MEKILMIILLCISTPVFAMTFEEEAATSDDYCFGIRSNIELNDCYVKQFGKADEAVSEAFNNILDQPETDVEKMKNDIVAWLAYRSNKCTSEASKTYKGSTKYKCLYLETKEKLKLLTPLSKKLVEIKQDPPPKWVTDIQEQVQRAQPIEEVRTPGDRTPNLVLEKDLPELRIRIAHANKITAKRFNNQSKYQPNNRAEVAAVMQLALNEKLNKSKKTFIGECYFNGTGHKYINCNLFYPNKINISTVSLRYLHDIEGSALSVVYSLREHSTTSVYVTAFVNSNGTFTPIGVITYDEPFDLITPSFMPF